MLENLFNKTVSLQDGGTVVVDEAYIRESIVNPAAKVAAGFQPIMPAFQGLVSEEGLLELIEYVKSLKTETATEQPTRPTGAAPAVNENTPANRPEARN